MLQKLERLQNKSPTNNFFVKKSKNFVPELHNDLFQRENVYKPFRANNSKFEHDLVLESLKPVDFF